MSNVDIVFDEAGLARLFDSADGPVARDLARRTIQVETAAKRNTPVDTGRLRSSMTHELRRRGDDYVGRVGTNVEYAIYVEMGTRFMAARAMLRNALSAARR